MNISFNDLGDDMGQGEGDGDYNELPIANYYDNEFESVDLHESAELSESAEWSDNTLTELIFKVVRALYESPQQVEALHTFAEDERLIRSKIELAMNQAIQILQLWDKFIVQPCINPDGLQVSVIQYREVDEVLTIQLPEKPLFWLARGIVANSSEYGLCWYLVDHIAPHYAKIANVN